MLHFLHAFSREVADNTPISSAIKRWTCVFVSLSGNYSLEHVRCGKLFQALAVVAQIAIVLCFPRRKSGL
ncbi:hypothetical protein EXN23_24085 [Agrobacterium salinitolerans]|uniref:Uncharacterized protein n=1 Tax=Agrobacterium salinitolerans TaxID=1183413 RepID=A0ABY3BI66_9HYPH|nr:hypothetical protein C2E26_09340 [Rhizobium sp. YIC5082]TRA83909.1 hypothetical protein EXN23_24085 [Agrobacterium salinitolerans]